MTRNNKTQTCRNQGVEILNNQHYFKSPKRLDLLSGSDLIAPPEKPEFKFFMFFYEVDFNHMIITLSLPVMSLVRPILLESTIIFMVVASNSASPM